MGALVAVDEAGSAGDAGSTSQQGWDGWYPPESALPVLVPAEALACLIYTSGSTGRPKGTALTHRAIVRLVRETNYPRPGPGDRMGQAANISFDAATYEIWGPLLNGAAGVVVPRETALSPPALAALLRQQKISSQFLTTALFTKVARELPEAFAGLTDVLFGGEALDPAAPRAVLATPTTVATPTTTVAAAPRRLLHFYGPAESTTFASWHRVDEVPPDASGVPIGMPVTNTTLYVLDRHGAVVPLGARGELAVGGDGLAWGYWYRPELTAERFVPHPWAAGERLYRTGDLVRRRADGVLEFQGRVDHQV